MQIYAQPVAASDYGMQAFQLGKVQPCRGHLPQGCYASNRSDGDSTDAVANLGCKEKGAAMRPVMLYLLRFVRDTPRASLLHSQLWASIIPFQPVLGRDVGWHAACSGAHTGC